MEKELPESTWGPSTRCVWGGEDEARPEGATVMPVFHGVTFAYDDLDAWQSVGSGAQRGHIYSRNTNPTVEAFEQKMRALEGADAAPASPPAWPPSATRSSRCSRRAAAW